jgi:hypothetical protein
VGRLLLESSRIAKQEIRRWQHSSSLGEEKKKYDPISAPSLVKMERMFRESNLGIMNFRRYRLIT